MEQSAKNGANKKPRIALCAADMAPRVRAAQKKTFYLFLWRGFCLTQTLQDSGQTTHGGGEKKITFFYQLFQFIHRTFGRESVNLVVHCLPFLADLQAGIKVSKNVYSVVC
jgi:hypothetical protein